jgi:Zn-finger protein
MSLVAVSDIAVLLDRQAAIDKGWVDALAAVKDSHPSIDFDDIIPSVSDRFSHGLKCEECHCPTVGVESISAGDIIRCCRDAISAIKQVSLVHRNPAVICIHCKIKSNTNGIVAGAIHITMDIEDSVDEDGVTHLGLKSKIAAGRVSLDTETDEVIVANA